MTLPTAAAGIPESDAGLPEVDLASAGVAAALMLAWIGAAFAAAGALPRRDVE